MPSPARRKISIVMPCFNEEANVQEAVALVRETMATLDYDYEHLFIDNASTDRTVELLRELCREDRHVKVIVNSRNFGHVRSPCHAMLQATGDAVVCLPSDMQERPTLIPALVEKWEEGARTVLTVKRSTNESFFLGLVRKIYYRMVNRLADVELVKDATGFGLFDRKVVEALRQTDDRYPYFRGLVADLGGPVARVPYDQQARRRGVTKNNFLTLYDVAMLGLTTHSKVPLRLATLVGFALSGLSLLTAFGYLIAKFLFWPQFPLGMAPMLIGLFTLASVQLFFIGLLGEYIGAIHTQVLRRPLVTERERINFEDGGS
ncbi:MAG: glycosyltransferase family 2 protein [Polyangiales bacterium]